MKYLRYIVFIALIVFALTKVNELYNELTKYEYSLPSLIFVFVFSLSSFFFQGLLTRTIVSFCQKQLNLFHAIGINALGGLWGLLLPFGSVAYKAIYLKKACQIEYINYTKFYGLSFASSIVASLFLYFCITLFYKQFFLSCILFLIIVLALLMVQYSNSVLKIIPKLNTFNSIQALVFKQKMSFLLKLFPLHLLGLVNYICILQMCFYSLNLDVEILHTGLFVLLQSILFLAPIVPGNFVILESSAVLLIPSQNLLDPAIAVLLMRFALLISLLFLGLISSRFSFYKVNPKDEHLFKE